MMRLAHLMRRGPSLFLVCVFGLGALSGCATPPPPPSRTTLILLPDDDGHVGSASLVTAQGRETLDEAFSATSTAGSAGTPSSARSLGRAAVDARYADLLVAQPLPPRSITLHFLLDRAVLTEASKARLPELLRIARERKPTVISLFGHADTSGTREYNLRLSLERAQAVASWLRQSDPSLDRLDVRAFGSAEPLTEPGVKPTDPRNRRVEVQIL
jgi:outer membrane protein OmpA-like peptidoglycan-associated protein